MSENAAEIGGCPLTCLNRLAEHCIIHRPAPLKADHVQCDLCGEVLHLRYLVHHGQTCPFRTRPGRPTEGGAT